MKKVRYALGAMGALPAIGMMMPATTAATTHAPKTTAKTVSLRHSSAATSGCTGNTEATASIHSVRLRFWHTYNPVYGTSCIGTVETVFSQSLLSSSYDRVRIYAHYLSGAKHRVYSNHIKAATGNQHFFVDGVHRSFGYRPIQVCTAAVHGNGSVFEGPVCRSVG